MSTYNGWKNYETWSLSLWLGEGMVDEETLASYTNPADLAEYLKELVEEFAPELPNGVYADLLNASIREIDFREIANHYFE